MTTVVSDLCESGYVSGASGHYEDSRPLLSLSVVYVLLMFYYRVNLSVWVYVVSLLVQS